MAHLTSSIPQATSTALLEAWTILKILFFGRWHLQGSQGLTSIEKASGFL